MRKFITIIGLMVLLCGCSKVIKTFNWTGQREVPAEGGSATWTPNVKDPHHWPEFTAIVTRVENTSDNEVIESELFEKPELTLTGEWYKVTGELNKITIDFKQNTTPYSRSISVYLDNPPGGYGFSVCQKPGI